MLAQLVKNLPTNAGDTKDAGSIPGWEDPLEEKMATPPLFLPGKSHGQRSLGGYSPGDRVIWGDRSFVSAHTYHS